MEKITIINPIALSELWKMRDKSFESVKHPEDIGCFTVGYEPVNEHGHGWYPYHLISKSKNNTWTAERIEMQDSF